MQGSGVVGAEDLRRHTEHECRPGLCALDTIAGYVRVALAITWLVNSHVMVTGCGSGLLVRQGLLTTSDG